MPSGATGKARKGMNMSSPTSYSTNIKKVDPLAKPPKKADAKKVKSNV